MDLVKTAHMGLSWRFGAKTLGYAPKQVSIEPTNVCNYKCSFCPQSTRDYRTFPNGLMSLETLTVILDKVQEAGAAWNETLSFTHDGEPLLNPDFPEFIALANRRGFKPRFSSNASRLSKEKADALEEAGFFRAAIDFSASERIFEEYRGKTGDWEVVRENLAYLIEMSNRNPNVYVEVREMGTIEDFKGDLKLADLEGLFPKATTDRVDFDRRVFHNAAGTMSFGALRSGNQKYRQCPYPWVSFNITYCGDVVACCRDLDGRTKLGNVLEVDSLWDIWNGEPYQEMREALANKQPEKVAACKGCDLPWEGDPEKWKISNIIRTLKNR
jgi:MoaA/NifB/PqqE/SkfB family radical SAM enzyme